MDQANLSLFSNGLMSSRRQHSEGCGLMGSGGSESGGDKSGSETSNMAGYNFEKPEEGRLAKGKSLTAQLGQRLQRHFAIPVEPEHDEFTLLLTKIKEKFDQQP